MYNVGEKKISFLISEWHQQQKRQITKQQW